MVHVFVTRVRELLTGLTRVTFSGCGGDPGVWEQAAKRRWREGGQEFGIQDSESGIREGMIEGKVDGPVPDGPSIDGPSADLQLRREQPVHSVRRT